VLPPAVGRGKKSGHAPRYGETVAAGSAVVAVTA
jgi:hypothetical protein